MIWTCSSFYLVLVLSYYKCFFAFRVPCCDVCYDFIIKMMFGSSLPPVVCGRAHILFSSVVFVLAKWCPTHIVLCFLLCSSSPCVSYVASFPGLSICVSALLSCALQRCNTYQFCTTFNYNNKKEITLEK